MTPTVTLSWTSVDSAGGDQGDTAVSVFQSVGAAATNTSTPSQVAKAMLYAAFGVTVGVGFGDGSPMVCRSVVPRAIGPNLMELVASYDVPPVGHYNPTQDPLTLPWRFEWKDCVESPPFDQDVNSNPVLNSAGSTPANPPTKTILKRVLTLRRNESLYDQAKYTPYENTVNSDTVTLNQPNGNEVTYPPGTLKMTTISPETAYAENDLVVPMALTMEAYSPADVNLSDPFQEHLLDQGPMGWYLDPTTNATKQGQFTVYDGQSDAWVPSPKDVLLDGTGKPLNNSNNEVGVTSQGYPPVANPNPLPSTVTTETAADGNAVYLVYQRYVKKPFLPILTQIS